MKTLKELKSDKIKLRNSEPIRAVVCEMIIDGATKIAKAENREVADADIIQAVRKSIKQHEEAITLIKNKGGNAAVWEHELAMLKEYMPPSMSDEEMRQHLDEVLASFPERTKKIQGQVIAAMKKYSNIDMAKLVALLNTILK